ncbi:unnamed protein product, partial [Adineta ricciae]
TKYPIDGSIFIPETLLNLNITINPPNIRCNWSFDIYLIDGRTMHFEQGSIVTYPRAGILKDYGATAGLQCRRGSRTTTLCFSHA